MPCYGGKTSPRSADVPLCWRKSVAPNEEIELVSAMKKKLLRNLLPLALVLFAGCASSPPSRFYVLTPEASGKQLANTSDLTLGVGPVRLVAYLERPQIVSRDSANQLRVEEFERWGGTLEGNITWVLAENLSRLLGTGAVVTYPWERVVETDYQIALDIRRFDPGSDGQVQLSVQWRVIGKDGGELYAIERSEFSEPVAGSGFAAQVAAQSRVLARLSEAIAARIGVLRSGSRSLSDS